MDRHHEKLYMKPSWLIVLFLIPPLAVFVLWLVFSSAKTTEGLSAPVDNYPTGSAISWQPWGEAAFARARAERQGVLLYFHAQWCSWCRQYQTDSLEHPRSVTLINNHYVPLLVDVDQRRDLFTRFGGRGLPYTVLLDTDAELSARFTGSLTAVDLQTLLAARASPTSMGATASSSSAGGFLINNPGDFLQFLEEAYDSDEQRLSGTASFGNLSKRPQPMSYRLLLKLDDWRTRMPGMLDTLRADLYDERNGGFFFYRDEAQSDPAAQIETAKVLGLNAQMIWLYADAVAEFNRESDRAVVRGALDYVRSTLWDETRGAFWGSQFSDAEYYQVAGRDKVTSDKTAPRVDRTQFADSSGQMIVAIIRAAQVLNQPELLEWAGQALAGLDARLMHSDGSYFHFREIDAAPQLTGYLPAQIWPAAAWWSYYAASGETHAARRGGQLIAQIANYENAELGGFSERLQSDLEPAVEPWTEPRTHGALAWLLNGPARAGQLPEEILTDTQRSRWYKLAQAKLQLQNIGDPDDVALGMQVQIVQRYPS